MAAGRHLVFCNYQFLHYLAAKFDLVSSILLHSRQSKQYIANFKIKSGDRPPFWICLLQLTSILLRLESQNVNCFLQYMIYNNLCCMLPKYSNSDWPPFCVLKIISNFHSITESLNLTCFIQNSRSIRLHAATTKCNIAASRQLWFWNYP